MIIIFVTLAVFQLKHFIADYPLQTSYMLGKFKGGKEWVLPLTAHAGIHFVFTLIIALCVNPSVWWVSILDFVLHFVMDRIKASPNLLGRFKALTAKDFPTATEEQKRGNKYFWWSLGLDQMVHHLTDLLIVFIMFN